MFIKALVLPNKYSDSMSLMALSTKVNELPIVKLAMIGMGTDLNKQVIDEVGLSTPEIATATPRDQIIVIQTETESDWDEAITQVEDLRAAGVVPTTASSYRSSRQAYEHVPEATLAIISVPGQYAAYEARAAVNAGRNVLLFSDNVTVEDEIDVKQMAHDRGLLVMGPDCGTAIINGTGLCFANAVARGPIGIVAASGTGSQELSVRIDALGSGITQLIGVGGRDLSEAVGGIMMLDGMAMLDADPQTSVIALISKPPAPSVAAKILAAAGELSKPVVVCFIGATKPETLPANVTFATNSRDTALAAVHIATGNDSLTIDSAYDFDYDAIRAAWKPGQTDIRGLFCGGTVCDEVFQVLKAEYPDRTRSNVAKDATHKLAHGSANGGNMLIDLGADEYTQGRPHPMIDPTLRNAEIVKHASDPATAVIVIDVELGFGASEDPAAAVETTLAAARTAATDAGRPLEIVAYVLGTDRDFQNRRSQIAALEGRGVRIVSNVIDLATVSLDMVR